jgi:hypothetical protein|tara:strand:+ start:406 stop:657 length:252 start_codon:yes stop_codon:yes gene_type:complete
MKSYKPQINDYVVWKRKTGDIDEGWVYFVDDSYITIEVGVKDIPYCEYTKNSLHCKQHTLVLCHNWYWHELQFLRKRKSVYDV